jgi:predicted homoserine dehydrogenase-like protein
MNLDLADRLLSRQEEGKSFRVGVIGAGKFATMFLSQANSTQGFHIAAIADLDFKRAEDALRTASFEKDINISGIDEAISSNEIWFTDSGIELAQCEQLDLVIEATGNPEAGVDHCLAAFKAKSHVVLVTVEADVLCGAAIIKRANEAGVVCSMAYGDQPALICELIERVKSSGFEIVCAGKGTKYLPKYHSSTPSTVWDYYGLSTQEAAAGGLNPKMFNSFLDGTKSAIEMGALANATGLGVPDDGLLFPAVGTSMLSQVLKPKEFGGVLANSGTVEVVSSLERDGTEIPDNLRWGVFVVFKSDSYYTEQCFREYGVPVDDSGQYAALWRPIHLIGSELGFSVATALLDKKSTGATKAFSGDAVSVAKRNLKAGELLDGEGGTTVWGKLLPAAKSISLKALPIGLAHNVKLLKDVSEGQVISQNDVSTIPESNAYILRKEMEAEFLENQKN